MSELGYNAGKSFDGVDSRITDLFKLAIASYDDPNISKINLKSGKREGDKRQHGTGNAIDITLVDKDGKEIPDYQNSKSWPTYWKFAQHARQVQQQLYPDLAKDFRWGGLFSGGIGKGGKYGAMDLMHFDLAGSQIPMAAGNWENGLNETWRKAWGIGQDAVQKAGQSLGIVDNPSGSSITPTGLNKTQQSTFDQVNSMLDAEGWSPASKAAILSSMSRESGFDPNATNNKGERSYGLFQWNGDRQDAMRAWAKEQGLDPASIDAQVGFFHHELNTTEKAAGQALRGATDVAGANAGMRRFERYGGGDAEEQARLQTAQQFLGGDYSAVPPSRITVLGTPTADPSLDPSAMQLALNEAGIKDTWGSALKPDGVIGLRTMTARDAALGKAKTLSASSSDKEIAAVQASLNSLGARGLDGNSLAVDGQFGPNTEYAISQLRSINRMTSPRMADDGTIRPQWAIADKTKNPLTNLSDVVSDIGDGVKNIFVNEDGDSRLIEGIKNIFAPSQPTNQPVNQVRPTPANQPRPTIQPFSKLTNAILPDQVTVPPAREPNGIVKDSSGIGSDANFQVGKSKLVNALAGGGIGSDAKYPTQESSLPYYADETLGKNLRYLEEQDKRRDFINKNRIRTGQFENQNSGFNFKNLLNAIFN